MMIAIFRILLRLYPRALRECFGAEMLTVFEQSLRERAALGPLASASYFVKEVGGLIAGVARARIAPVRVPGRGSSAVAVASANLPAEVAEAEARVVSHLRQLQSAIARRQFAWARSCSLDEARARAELRLVREKYGIAE